MMYLDDVARICHEANRAFCRAQGDFSQPEWDNCPEWQRSSAINGVKLHISKPDAKADETHQSWWQEKFEAGWVYGPVKDPEAKTHPCCVPFEELPIEQQTKDHLFKGIVRTIHCRLPIMNSERPKE